MMWNTRVFICVVVLLIIILSLCVLHVPSLYQQQQIKQQHMNGAYVHVSKILSAGLDLTRTAGSGIRHAKKQSQRHVSVKGFTDEGVVDPVTDADKLSSDIIVSGLRRLWPSLNVVSEESDDDTNVSHRKISKQLPRIDLLKFIDDDLVNLNDVVVFVDPLDATLEFTENLLQYVTTMVCVVVKGKPLAAVISWPMSPKDPAIFGMVKYGINGLTRVKGKPGSESIITISRSHAGIVEDFFSFFPNHTALPAGGSGYKSVLLLEGKADAYIHITAIKAWDICAGDALLSASGGGRITDLDGVPLHYDAKQTLFQNGLVAAPFNQVWYRRRAQLARSDIMSKNPLAFSKTPVFKHEDHGSSGNKQNSSWGSSFLPCYDMNDCEQGYGCLSGLCGECDSDADCSKQSKLIKCTESDKQLRRICRHKNLFDNFDRRDVVLTIVVILSVAIATGGGLGGGGLLVPAFLLIGEFTPNEAVPLSKATILGASVANVTLLLRRRHPLTYRPLIDFDVSILLEPLTLLGSVVGVHFNRLAPRWLISIMLIVVLTVTAFRTLRKGFYLWPRESRISNIPTTKSNDGISLMVMDNHHVDHKSDTFDKPSESSESLMFEEFIREEKNPLPFKRLQPLVVSWISVFVLSLLCGSKNTPSIVGLSSGEPMYWLLLFSNVPIAFGCTIVTGRRLLCKQALRDTLSSYNQVDGDFRWTFHSVIKYPICCFSAGFVAGTLGIGGGMIKGPLMLEMGMLPQVASATASFMIFFTASSTTFQFFVVRAMITDYALWFTLFGCVAGFSGSIFVHRLVLHYNRASVIILIIGFVVAFAALVIGIDYISRIYKH